MSTKLAENNAAFNAALQTGLNTQVSASGDSCIEPECEPRKAREHRRSASSEGGKILWRPPISTDDESLEWERDKYHARAIDVARNDPQAAGAADSLRASTVGHKFLLDATVSARALGVSEDRADEIAEEIEDKFDLVAESPRFWLDAGGQRTFSALALQVMWNYWFYGETFTVSRFTDNNEFSPTPLSLLSIDPRRVNSPRSRDLPKDANVYHGIDRSTESGYPRAYYVERNSVHDATVKNNTRGSNRSTHIRVPRTDRATGAWLMIHAADFTKQSNSTRPLPPLATMMHLLRRTGQYNDAVLDAAWKSALLGIAMTSDVPNKLQDMFNTSGMSATPDNPPWSQYQDSMLDYFEGAGTQVLDGVQPFIMPVGSKLELLQPGQPTAQVEQYNRVLDRMKASGINESYERFSGDYSQTNFHGAMMGDMKAAQQRRVTASLIPERWGRQVVSNWLMMELVADNIESLRGIVPTGVTDAGDPRAIRWYRENSDAISFSFLPPGHKWANPQVMYNAYKTGIEAGLTTHRRSIAEMHGERARTIVKQNLRHERFVETMRSELGLQLDDVPAS